MMRDYLGRYLTS